MEGGIPHLGCSISRALWRHWSGTAGTGNYFLVLSLTVHASGSWLKQCFILQRLRRLLVLPDLDPQCLPGQAQARRLLPVISWAAILMTSRTLAAGATASKMFSFTSNNSP